MAYISILDRLPKAKRAAKIVAPKHALYIRQIAILFAAIINISLFPICNITRYSLSTTNHFGISLEKATCASTLTTFVNQQQHGGQKAWL